MTAPGFDASAHGNAMRAGGFWPNKTVDDFLVETRPKPHDRLGPGRAAGTGRGRSKNLSSGDVEMQNQGTPAQSFGTVSDLIRAHALQRLAHPALVLDGRSLDYAGLDALMDRVAASLQRDGVNPGEVIAVCAATSIEYAAVFLGGVRAGVVVAPLAPDATAAGLAAMLADAGAKMLFLNQAAAHSLEAWPGQFRPDGSVWTIQWLEQHSPIGWPRLAQRLRRWRYSRTGRSTSSIPPAPPAHPRGS